MTTPSELADELVTISVVNTYTARGQLAENMLANLPTILSALRRVEKMEGALEKAEQFIVNGTELGFIRMPETANDPAHLTLPAIRQALTGEA